MKEYRKASLAGIAALAIVAGTGFAAAQMTNSGSETGQSRPMSSGGAAMRGGANAGMHAQSRGGAGMSAQNPSARGMRTQSQGQAQTGLQRRNPQNLSPANRMTQTNRAANGNRMNEQLNAAQGQRTLRARQGLEQQNAAQGQRTLRARQGLEQQNAQGQRTLRSRQGLEQQNAQGQRTLRARQGLEERNTAQGQRGIRGLQGNAAGQRMQASSGTNVRLSDQQRARIRQTIIESNRAPRVGHVNFGVNVGTVIPRRAFTTIRVVPVPEYLTRIEPRWHGYEYFVYADRMVIVNPRTLRIVAVIPV